MKAILLTESVNAISCLKRYVKCLYLKKNSINENFFQHFKERMDIETVNANPNEILVSYHDKLAVLINQYLP